MEIVCKHLRILGGIHQMAVIPPHYLELVADAALKSYWRKKSLALFLRRCGVSETFVAGWSKDESKRDLLYRLFPRLEAQGDAGLQLVNRMTDALVQQESFPDLEGWEDTKKKVEDAKRAVAALKAYRATQAKRADDERERVEAKRRAAEISAEIRQRRNGNRPVDLTAFAHKRTPIR